MKITYLGQAGLLFETGGKKIVVDPYLTDSVERIEPHNKRRVPVDPRFLDMKPDAVICTHAHEDHTDLETLVHYITPASSVLVLAPYSAYTKVLSLGGINNNFVNFNDGTVWTEDYAAFRAVHAEHSDERAIGVIISAEGKHYYITGDTLYSERVFASLPDLDFEATFIPVNGRGNNLNFADARRFVARLKTRFVVPYHVGLFDSLSPATLNLPNMLLPQFYKPIPLP